MLEDAKRNLSAFDHVVFVKSIYDDMQVIHEALRIKIAGRMKRENVGRRDKHTGELPKSAEQLLHEVVGYVQRLYEYAWSLRRGSK